MTLTDKQKKLAWIVGGILLAIHFTPGIWNNLRQEWAARSTPAHSAKPSPVHTAPAVPPPTAPVGAPSPNTQFAKLIGIWAGTAVLSNRDFCQVRLELRASPDQPGDYTGYSSMSCAPLMALAGHTYNRRTLPPDDMQRMAPVSTVLSGPVKDGAIRLMLQQSITTTPDGCQPTAYTLTPFAEKLGAKFDRGTCQGGQLVMQRVSR
jgi:hypothetical protein